VLVDGNNHQIDCIQAEAQKRQVEVAIVVDFIHVLEYLWQAAWCFNSEGDADAGLSAKAVSDLERDQGRSPGHRCAPRRRAGAGLRGAGQAARCGPQRGGLPRS
jgi:hypothetical protein